MMQLLPKLHPICYVLHVKVDLFIFILFNLHRWRNIHIYNKINKTRQKHDNNRHRIAVNMT